MERKNNKGFTFIELVLYIGILSIFMTAVTTLVGTVVSSNRKMTSRKKIQNEAGDTYDTISDMFMMATSVQIIGKDSADETRLYIKPNLVYDSKTHKLDTTQSDIVNDDGTFSIVSDATRVKLGLPSGISESKAFDISKAYSYGDIDPMDVSTADQAVISPVDGKLYVKIAYASGLNSSGDSIITVCTLVYDETNRKLYLSRTEQSDADATTNYFVDASASENNLLCKNVDAFKLQLNPSENSVAIRIELEDTTTAVSYVSSGVVNIRNSNVLHTSTTN